MWSWGYVKPQAKCETVNSCGNKVRCENTNSHTNNTCGIQVKTS